MFMGVLCNHTVKTHFLFKQQHSSFLPAAEPTGLFTSEKHYFLSDFLELFVSHHTRDSRLSVFILCIYDSIRRSLSFGNHSLAYVFIVCSFQVPTSDNCYSFNCYNCDKAKRSTRYIFAV